MAVSAGAFYRTSAAGLLDIGVEPPIQSAAKPSVTTDRRNIPVRWLAAVVLTGIAGSGLIGITIYAALDGQTSLAQLPELAGPSRQDIDTGNRLVKGDRLIRSADIVAEKQSFRIPTVVKVGDKQTMRMRAFTHVATTLALAPTGADDDIPDFNPLKLLANDVNPADSQADPPAVVDDADVTFTTRDLAGSDPTLFGGTLSADEIEAQVSEYGRGSITPGRIPLPPQWLLMHTSRAGLLPTNNLGYAEPGLSNVPFSSIEVRMVPENVTPIARADPARDPRVPGEKLVVFRHGDQLDDILRANGATRDQAKSIIQAFNVSRGEAPVADGRRLKFVYGRLSEGKPPQVARVSVYADENLLTTVALADDGVYVQVTKADSGGRPTRPQPTPQDDDDGNGFRLYDSLYGTALKQQIPRPVIDTLVRIFANDVDFQRHVAGGDSFDAFYGDADEGESHPELLYASITVRNDVFKYYRFQTLDDGNVDFYDETGRSVRKFLMRSPVPNAQLTSGFGLRFHPILGYSRPHTGVDWAAPIGTPILAAGSGTVLRAHRESGYGNHVEIQHANGYITTYSHMAAFGRGVTDGARIKQGQVVGFLGQTGLATGPHLHYEVIINGRFVDPMTVKLARTREMDGRALADFKRERDRIDQLMASAPNAEPARDNKSASN